MKKPQGQREEYNPPSATVKKFLGDLGYHSLKGDPQVAFALKPLIKIVKKLLDHSRDKENQNLTKVLCKLADTLHVAYGIAIGLPDADAVADVESYLMTPEFALGEISGAGRGLEDLDEEEEDDTEQS